MKKILYLSFVFCVLCLFTGCGSSKVLKCSKDNIYNEEIKTFQTINITFNGNDITKVAMDMNVELSDDFMENRSEYIETVKSEFDDLEGSKGFKHSIELKDKGFKSTVRADLKQMSEESLAELYIFNTQQSYDDTKLEYEKDGYTCK